MRTKRFTMVSPIRGTKNTNIRNQKVTKEDIFDRIIQLSKPAQKLFIRLKSTHDYKYNTSHITKEESELVLNRGPYKTLMNNIKAIEEAEIALRLPYKYSRDLKLQERKDYIFLINPYLIHPTEDYIVSKIWEELVAEKTKSKCNT